MKSDRNFPLDLLRVLACYLVIHQHASEFFYVGEAGSVVPGENTFWIGIITSIARISVPLFVMISGFLLLPMKGPGSEFFKKRFVRILGPFVVWSALYALYYVATRGDSWGQAITNILHIPVNFGVEVGHLWYIYMLVGLYLIVPVISPWLAKCSKAELQGYLGLWGVTTLIPYIHLIFPQIWGECFWNPTPAFYYFSGFIGYFLLGFHARRYGPLSLSWAVLLTVVGYIVTAAIFCSRVETAATIPDLELSWGFCTVNVAMMTYGVFSIFLHVKARGESRMGRLVQDISLKSYGIYLAHIMILTLFVGWLRPLFSSTLTAVPVMALCSFVCTYLLVRLLSYLPRSRYWLG